MQLVMLRLFQVLLFLVPFAWTAQTEELFELNKMVLTYALTVIILVVWAWRMISAKRVILKTPPFFWFLLIWLLSQLMSTIFSIHPHTSIFGYYSRFHGGLLSSLTYAMLYLAAVSNFTHKDVKPLIQSLLIGSLGVVLYAIPEHFGVSPSCVLISGEFTTECWSENTNPRYRIFGTFGQPNWLAAYLLMTIPLSMVAIDKFRHQMVGQLRKNWLKLSPLVLTFALSVVALLYTGSRSGFLGLLISLTVFAGGLAIIWWQGWRLKKGKAITSAVPASLITTSLSLILAGFLIMGLIGTPYSPSLYEWINTQISRQSEDTGSQSNSAVGSIKENSARSTGTVLENGGTDSGAIRAIVWRGALDVWRRYPIWGSGVETFAYSYYRDRPAEHNLVSEWDFLYNKAHNEFLNILATSGLIGLLAYLGLMASFTWTVLKNLLQTKSASAEPSQKLVLLALISGYAGLAVSNFAGFSTVMVGILFFLWPALAWLSVQTEEDNSANDSAQVSKKTSAHKKYSSYQTKKLNKDSRSSNQDNNRNTLFKSEGQWIGAAGAGLVGFLLLLNVLGMWNNDRLFAQSKRSATQGKYHDTYQQLATLTQRAPNQAEYWEQYGSVLSQLAVQLHLADQATAAAELTELSLAAIDQAILANSAHLNIWKSRANALIWLTNISAEYYEPAIESLEIAHELAPTDPKILYNLALAYESSGQSSAAQQAFEQAIALKPNYEQARKKYAEFLTKQSQYELALEQYRYIDEVLKPGENLFSAEIASLSAELRDQANSSNKDSSKTGSSGEAGSLAEPEVQ